MAKRKQGRKSKKQLNKIMALVAAVIIVYFGKDAVIYKEYRPVKGIVQGRVVKVSDGDTVTLLSPQREKIKIRLYGIDAPEKKQDYGSTAKKALSSVIAGEDIEADIIDIDRYGRPVGLLTLRGEDINRLMVERGYAWVYPQYCRIERCTYWVTLQEEAKARKKGLWNMRSPQEPWLWRKDNK
ncbi:Putative nuclease [Elusimicrobium minutum Pei191]|uniref:Putative nuclease n=1 Tax=Elusimicrobium minutum (strain Pei191) TaxID=445932 RepID=B2KBS0_ELUMP|nr:thermonuclease family protein [Elusimicrobium minutum]ACC97757.1 Putative nuclease [Elusimicrobium minutum Pei191]